MTRSRVLCPEVVQSSAMDCGPASLAALLRGHGIRVSLGRLREACQTDVDGTSISTIADVADQLGLRAAERMEPSEHLLLPEAELLPALAVVTLPNGLTHFVVVWRRHGPWVQVMDPAQGRRWMRCSELQEQLYNHAMEVPAADWSEFARSEGMLAPLRARLSRVGLPGGRGEALTREAAAFQTWGGLAALDAGTRMAEALVKSGGVGRAAAGRLLEATLEEVFADRSRAGDLIPLHYWLVTPSKGGGEAEGDQEAAEGEEMVLMRGAVVVTIDGLRPGAAGSASSTAEPVARPPDTPEPDEGSEDAHPGDAQHPVPLPPDLAAALTEPPERPGRELLRLLRADGALAPGALTLALVASAGVVVVEALLLRGLLDLGSRLSLPLQRLGAAGALVVLMAALAALELPMAGGVLRLGRRLEIRFRAAFLRKIPRLGDRYFHSRLTSDMAERGHSVHAMRGVPDLVEGLLRGVFGLIFTTAGIAWVDGASLPAAATVSVISVALPLMMQPLISERDLRQRTHGGALTRFYLDALLGLLPVRAHGAERAVRREHEHLLTEWARAGLSRLRASVVVQGALSLAGVAMSAWLILGYVGRQGEPAGILLLVYWSLNLPALGGQVAQSAAMYPSLRSVTLRLTEPLTAPEETGDVPAAAPAEQEPSGAPGVALALAGVDVVAGGNPVLRQVNLTIAPGEQVAVVGPSGAGKSTLLGLLLGWHRAAAGEVAVDGEPLSDARLFELRQRTAWVDPSVRLWNRTLLANLCYGNPGADPTVLPEAIEAAQLRDLLGRLPDGLQTPLGEGGGRLSGGEGQRVRLGRAALRGDARLVLLDEPFRGLDRPRRRDLLAGARRMWHRATMLCVTHDVGETLTFPRVLVVVEGRVVEDGDPRKLADTEGSSYRALLRQEEAVMALLHHDPLWTRVELRDATLRQTPEGPA